MRQRIKKWGFEKKMKVFFSASIILVSLLVLLITTVMSTLTAFDNARQSAENQLSFLCANYESSLEQYKSTCYAILMDSTVQEYLEAGEWETTEEYTQYLEYMEGARGILQQTYNANDNINFVGLINDKNASYVYRGEAVSYTAFEQNWKLDWAESIQGSQSTMRLSFNDAYYWDGRYTLSIYFPAYSNQILGKSYGLLCINLQDTFLESLSTQEKLKNAGNSELLLVDMEGNLVSGSDTEMIGQKLSFADGLNGSQGTLEHDGNLISYQKIGNWNYYLLSVSPMQELYMQGIRMAILVAVLVLLMIVICTTIAGKILSRVYAPLDDVVKQMATVSEGRMDVRISAERLGTDFEQMADGFNTMMDRLCEAMEEIRIKQEQISQTRLNALQAQIHPHFLYNTLDCIHWQAVAEGNKEISTLVKALASYYRICLSKGKDIIPLSQELQHIKYYLLIQNMRYDHRVELEVCVDERYNDMMMPKLTLQPLVENAIEHGIGRSGGKGGRIRIWIEEEQQDVLLKLSDSGTGITPEKIEEMNRYLHEEEVELGYGVRNVNRRIELLFGDHYGLEYAENENHGAVVTVRLPHASCEILPRESDHIQGEQDV